jgi:D-alanine transfer protein
MIHTVPASIAAAILAAVLFLFDRHVDELTRQFTHSVAPLMFGQKELGSAFQRAAFGNSDLLPIYGSSELQIPSSYHPNTVFRSYPSGFTTFPVGKPDTTCLIILQKLAAVGQDLRGKRVVISLSPGSYYKREMVEAAPYAGNFSPLHANALAFSSDLSLELKQAVARRMVQYPATLEGDALLRLAVTSLAATSSAGRLWYSACIPLGCVRNVVLRLQDQWETYKFIVEHPKVDPDVPQQFARLDWRDLLVRAEREYQRHAANNPFGIEDSGWTFWFRADADRQKGKWTDPVLLAGLEHAQEWTDLDLLLQGLKELGAQPLVLSLPLKGAYARHLGTTPAGRAAFYGKMRQAVGRFGVPFLDFEEYEGDRFFLADPTGHLADKGWVVVDRVLDAFYFNLVH